ncbi:RSP_2647 family RNA methyltransferase [Oceanicella actignis]|uniref:RSP_2647 family RNA methyltransferase n=1 Tax=Oceanicella actignis TaxID=1189325 RepID=UPI0011E7F478|nr:class I SAM-dependent methyltransferase [Oceanicella actignis]TYO85027.1 SAM-dependent methyltransferase [Oceanicella actignis]
MSSADSDHPSARAREAAEAAPPSAPAGDDPATRPTVRLRPKAGRRLSAGAPWAYADELVMDRRTRKLAPGSLVELQDAERAPLGLAAFNPDSVIAARLLDEDPAARVDADWFAARIARAQRLREALFDAPFHRLIHAEADGLPGVVIDRFGDAAAVQPNAAWADARIEALVDALVRVTGVRTVVLNGASRARRAEGLEDGVRVLRGGLDGPVPTPMNGAVYMADLTGGQKTGLFYDQRPNHAFVARLARGGRMLDVFSHVGGFALAALAAGATHALAVDGSARALELAEEGARRSGVADRFETRRADAFEALAALAEEGARFETVVCDPPAFAPSRQAREAGLRAYRRLARMAAPLVAEEGWLTLCSCSHAVDAEAFRAACAQGLRAAGRRARLIWSGRAGPDHPVHPALPETSYLKALVFALD